MNLFKLQMVSLTVCSLVSLCVLVSFFVCLFLCLFVNYVPTTLNEWQLLGRPALATHQFELERILYTRIVIYRKCSLQPIWSQPKYIEQSRVVHNSLRRFWFHNWGVSARLSTKTGIPQTLDTAALCSRPVPGQRSRMMWRI